MLEQAAGALFGLMIFLVVILEFVWVCPCIGHCKIKQKRNINITRLVLLLGIVITGGGLAL